MQIKWLARAHTDPLAISNMRLAVHYGHHDTIRPHHRSQQLHQLCNTVNIITNTNNISSYNNINSNSSSISQATEMEIAALLRSQPHQCQPDRRCTISNSTSKLASTLTRRPCKKKMSNTAAAVNVHDIDRITNVHYFDAYSIIYGMRGPVSNFPLQLVISHTLNLLRNLFFSFFPRFTNFGRIRNNNNYYYLFCG